MTESEVRAIIASHDLLVARARRIGYQWLIATSGRERPALLPMTEADLHVTIEQEKTYLSWYRHGDNETDEFPTSLLWRTPAAIQIEVDTELASREQRRLDNALKARARQEATERAWYERLKEKYE